MARIEPDRAGHAGRQELEHPARAGAEIEAIADGLGAERLDDGGLHGRLGGVERTDAVPFRREAGEEGLRVLGALGAHGGEPGPVVGELCVGAVEGGEHRAQDAGPGTAVREAKERPGALPVAFHEPCFHEELQMARDAGLGLAEDVGEVRNRELALGQKRQNPQAGFFGRGPQGAEGFLKAWLDVRSSAPTLQHIKICLYAF
jgi:hypothetical protein